MTLYSLFLGGQDSVTGWYTTGYTIQAIIMAVVPRSAMHMLSGMGVHSRHDAVGFTNYAVSVGDVVKDAFDQYYTIVGLEPNKWGNVFAYYACHLQELEHFSFISGFFGFEDTEHGLLGYEFETGFERGFFAL